jgi:HAD superfamily hydrolase (TIGR01509 family)
MKVIGFDLVGVLVGENSFELNDIQDKMERLFGKNKSDYEYKKLVEEKISNEIDIEENTRYIINNIYEVKYPNLIFELKNKYPNVILIIATNHISYIRDYIERNFDMSIIDKIYVSAEMNEVKPNAEFYKYILNDLNIKANDMLFLDDNLENIDGAKILGINTIKINKDTNILDAINNFFK